MQSLADYGTPSPSPSPPPAAAKPLPSVNLDTTFNSDQPRTGNDDSDDEYDPTDAFGLRQVQQEAKEHHAGARQGDNPDALVDARPEVIAQFDPSAPSSLLPHSNTSVIFYNAPHSALTAPVQGPKNPWDDERLERQNALTGHVEQQHFSAQTFAEQQRSFHVLGYAANPSIASGSLSISSNDFVPEFSGNVHAAYKNGGVMVSDFKRSRKEVKEIRRKRKAKGRLGEFDDPDDEKEGAEGEGEGEAEAETEEGDEEEGPQPAKKAKKEKKEQREYLGPWAGWDGESNVPAAPTQEEYEWQEEHGGPLLNKEQRRKKEMEARNGKEVGWGEEKSVLHGAYLIIAFSWTSI
ncbi:hypothetical protein JCM11641_005566 [Rhodosporidiobolus odoratus]